MKYPSTSSGVMILILVHIKQNAVTCGHIVVSVMMADKMFDLGKHLLNRIQIGGVGGEVLDPNSCVYKNC
jgi:hypothetical protein